MRRLATALLVLLTAAPLAAQTPGNCLLGRAQADLDVSDVRARLFNTGSLAFGNTSEAAYIVPKMSGHSPLFTAGLWIGGQVGGELRVAGSRYTRFEFWPGPLDDGAALPDPNDCSAFDRIYVVSVLDVLQYDESGFATADLAEWPVGLGAPAVDAQGNPIVPGSREQVLDLAAGERPVVYGTQTAWWVMNDVGNDHDETGSAPLGVEVQVAAFSLVTSEAALNQATVYRYRITNRSPNPIDSMYVSFFTDPDLGDAGDDYTGSDTTRNLGYTYNGEPEDNTYGIPPAAGYLLLQGPEVQDEPLGLNAVTFICGGCAQAATSDPRTKEEYYHHMQGRWKDGTPFTATGGGFMTNGPVTTYWMSGDPVEGTCWSMVNPCIGDPISPNDQRLMMHTGPFQMAPGAVEEVIFALPFAQGTDYLDSVTELRRATDILQARFDDGLLFETITPALLEAPRLLSPEDGATFFQHPPLLEWSAVPGATRYAVDLLLDGVPLRESNYFTQSFFTTETRSQPDPDLFPPNRDVEITWRIRAEADGTLGRYSEPRTFLFSRYQPDWEGGGEGIVETAYPGVPDVCAGAPADPGCQAYGGNTVWHSPNSTGDYYLSSSGGATLQTTRAWIEAASPYDYEIRFTEACAIQGCYAAEYVGTSSSTMVVQVPFEVWNTGSRAGRADEVRMIPLIQNPDGPVWTDRFPYTDFWAGSLCKQTNGERCPITAPIYAMMPDRPDGYARFEQAALASGGTGATYVDTDTTITPLDPDRLFIGDINPSTGKACMNQGRYLSWCYRNDRLTSPFANAILVTPISRFVIADLAGDGTTPPVGTVIRLPTVQPPPGVASEPGPGATVPEGFTLGAAYPNPFRRRAAVPFEVARAGAVRVSVYDVLGREVAVLVDGAVAAGRHEAVLTDRGLASGVYVVTLAAEGVVRASQRVLLLR